VPRPKPAVNNELMKKVRMATNLTTNQAMKVLLVDDHPLVLSALQSVIQSIGGDTTVVGVDSAAGARATLKADSDFDLVLLDLGLGDADGFDVLVEFRSTYPAVPVVVVSASDRTSDVIRAIDSGAMGFVPKKSSHQDLYDALRMVMEGAMYVPRSMLGLAFGSYASGALQREAADTQPGVMHMGHMADGTQLGPNAKAEPHQKVPSLQDLGLTPRQAEVLSLLLQGLPNKLIARQLNLSVETVKDHVAAVLRALGVSSRTQAVLAVSQMHQGPGGFVARTPPQR
jgi:DNA-binding NarL/FixJ family response regulator